jgi:predicted nucleotidyltransferase
MMNEEEHKRFAGGKDQDSDILIKSPSFKKINLKFIEPKLSEEQTEAVLKNIEDNQCLDYHNRNYMKKLLESKHKIQIIDALAEFQRKDNFIRIFPSPGSNSYFKYFTHKLEINEELYDFLYE